MTQAFIDAFLEILKTHGVSGALIFVLVGIIVYMWRDHTRLTRDALDVISEDKEIMAILCERLGTSVIGKRKRRRE